MGDEINEDDLQREARIAILQKIKEQLKLSPTQQGVKLESVRHLAVAFVLLDPGVTKSISVPHP